MEFIVERNSVFNGVADLFFCWWSLTLGQFCFIKKNQSSFGLLIKWGKSVCMAFLWQNWNLQWNSCYWVEWQGKWLLQQWIVGDWQGKQHMQHWIVGANYSETLFISASLKELIFHHVKNQVVQNPFQLQSNHCLDIVLLSCFFSCIWVNANCCCLEYIVSLFLLEWVRQ